MSAALQSTGAQMFSTTFYSYKGGVGRSVALLNVANQLALRGRSVVMIDFDLEAPGLHSAVTKVWPEAAESVRPARKGVLDYLLDYKDTATETRKAVPPPLDEYLSEPFGPNRLIRLIQAGDLGNYARYTMRLADLGIIDFAQRWYGRELLLQLRLDLADRFEYLLIDSRTGHTDALGATTVLLPHAVVLLSNLSEQSVQGTAYTLDFIQSHGTHNGRTNARENGLDNDEELNILCARDRGDPDIETLVVASPIPFGDQTGLRRAAETLERPVDHVIYHVPRIAAHETEHVIGDTTGGRRSETSEIDPAFLMYAGLADKIEALNPYEPRALAQLGLDSLARQDWRVALGYFRSAERFLAGSEENRRTLPDRVLQVRLWLGKARALALGFQTEHAAKLIRRADQAINELRDDSGIEHLMVDLIVARMQLVRGLYGADELTEAMAPASAAREAADQLCALAGRPDAWQLSAGLVSADSKILGGEYRAAAAEAEHLPSMARRLNRRVEMVRALQLRAQAWLNAGNILDAQTEAERAVDEAEAFGVDYLSAEAYLTAAQVEISAGSTRGDRGKRLEKAAQTFRDVGDGFGTANCESELGQYRNRLGQPLELVRADLVRSIRGYQRISGTSLGEITTLLYATRALLDHGETCQEVPEGVRSDLEGSKLGERHSSLPPLTAQLVAHELPRAADTLVLAALIARDREVTLMDDLIAAYWLEVVLFSDPAWLAYVQKELGFSGVADVNPDRTERQPTVDLEVERSLLLNRMLRQAPGDAHIINELWALAEEANGKGAAYNEVATVALAALGLGAAGHMDEQENALQRLQDLHRKCSFEWTVWGQVRACRDRLRNGASAAWKPAAEALLVQAAARGLPVPP